jgi:hypothetical protein
MTESEIHLIMTSSKPFSSKYLELNIEPFKDSPPLLAGSILGAYISLDAQMTVTSCDEYSCSMATNKVHMSDLSDLEEPVIPYVGRLSLTRMPQ